MGVCNPQPFPDELTRRAFRRCSSKQRHHPSAPAIIPSAKRCIPVSGVTARKKHHAVRQWSTTAAKAEKAGTRRCCPQSSAGLRESAWRHAHGPPPPTIEVGVGVKIQVAQDADGAVVARTQWCGIPTGPRHDIPRVSPHLLAGVGDLAAAAAPNKMGRLAMMERTRTRRYIATSRKGR